MVPVSYIKDAAWHNARKPYRLIARATLLYFGLPIPPMEEDKPRRSPNSRRREIRQAMRNTFSPMDGRPVDHTEERGSLRDRRRTSDA